MAGIRDGLSNTIAVVQVDDASAVEWTKPEDWELDDSDPTAGLGGLHAGGMFLAAFCDGHVAALNVDMAVENLKALLSYAGGEVVEAP